jgi:hypothetical protein
VGQRASLRACQVFIEKKHLPISRIILYTVRAKSLPNTWMGSENFVVL